MGGGRSPHPQQGSQGGTLAMMGEDASTMLSFLSTAMLNRFSWASVACWFRSRASSAGFRIFPDVTLSRPVVYIRTRWESGTSPCCPESPG